MGLMPAYRGGETPLWGLKTVVIAPGNAARGLDLHQGFVALFDGETGETRALLNAGGITAVRTAAVSAVATRLLARDDARTLAILGAGIQGKAHLEAMRAVRDFDRVVAWSRTPGRAAAELDGVEEVATVEEALRDADVVVTATSAPEPIVQRGWLKAGRPRERRRLEHPDDARARHRDDARRVVVRRPARVDGQRGRRLPLPAARGRDRPRAHPRRDRRAADRRRPRDDARPTS